MLCNTKFEDLAFHLRKTFAENAEVGAAGIWLRCNVDMFCWIVNCQGKFHGDLTFHVFSGIIAFT